MRKQFIGLVLASLVLAVPALAVDNNGFETDYCYAKSGSDIHLLSQADGSLVGNMPNIAGETHCFSNSPVCGANSPAGARLFTAERYKLYSTKYDEILVREYDATGQEIRRSYLSWWWHGAPHQPLNSDNRDLVLGTIRYNPVNNTLIVSASRCQRGWCPAGAWEFELPDWPAGTPAGGGVQFVHAYVLGNQSTNRTNIAINPNDGTMYVTGYKYISGGGLTAFISSTATSPPDDVNTVQLDGWVYDALCDEGQWYQPSAITYQDMVSGNPELHISHESSWSLYQPYAFSWTLPGICVMSPSHTEPMPLLARIGTPGSDLAGAQNRRRGVRAATDLYTGEAFICGNGTRDGNGGGVLQVKNERPHTGSLVLGGVASGYGDADSPGAPPPPVQVNLDVLPSDAANLFTVNMQGKGRLPIAILGSEDYDVNAIDLDSLNIAGVVLPVKEPKIEKDENGDGLLDLVMHFSKREVIAALGLDLMDCNGTVVEIAVDGTGPCGLPIVATDEITLVCRED
ncbi:MAG: hypothetical protein JSV03_00455 [Planctomycetota bacterium]|nr:MAG: hypothetical protein JSV03_00455 [Planctomycetota bacterium]